MKRFLITTAALLLLATGVKAASHRSAKEKNYWVTETGPRCNPYTVIRLYDRADRQILEILMSGYRLRTNKASVKKSLSRLAEASPVDAADTIAAILGIEACRISSVKKTDELHI